MREWRRALSPSGLVTAPGSIRPLFFAPDIPGSGLRARKEWPPLPSSLPGFPPQTVRPQIQSPPQPFDC